MNDSVPCVLFEDEHLMAVNKPAGINTHAPGPFAGEGLYDWLRHREPRWASLAIIHRLDKETSGVLVFGKSALANRSLTAQFAGRTVRKKYRLLTDRAMDVPEQTVDSVLVRVGEKYVSRPRAAKGDRAQTRFRVLGPKAGCTEMEAEPITGRTHQIRVHAADHGFAILGDTLYGGTPHARVCLHAAELVLNHPATNEPIRFAAPADFAADPRWALRAALLDPQTTNAYRLIHGAADGWPGWYLDRAGDFLLSSSAQALTPDQRAALDVWRDRLSLRGAYHRILHRQVRGASAAVASPARVTGEAAPESMVVLENGLRFELSFSEGYSVGLFLDQRDNRRRLLRNHVAADFPVSPSGLQGRTVLNTFAYTCGFSVCAARAGARVTSLDLSKKYLEWGRRNFGLNTLDPGGHEFVDGDVFDWLRRWTKKRRRFEVVLLDPPTFSTSKQSGAFQAEADYGALVTTALPVLAPGGVLFAATNAARLNPEQFLALVEDALAAAGRRVSQRYYAPQPPDFPVSRAEPAYLKTAWWQVT
ncbi:MAG: pseudouridine synthase [Limisphaerales bacterium]